MSDIVNPIGQIMKKIIKDQINGSGIVSMIKELDSLIDSAVNDKVMPQCKTKVDLINAHDTDGRIGKSIKQGT